MRAVLLRAFGGAENLFFGQTPLPTVAKQGDVLLRVHATAINRADVLQREGKYPPPPGSSELLGLEAAGVVMESRSTRWTPGDRVMALLPGGGYGEYCLAHEAALIRIPASWSFAKAASVPEVFLTAFQLLRLVACIPRRPPDDVADSARGSNILVHAAASGVGTAAIQVAKHLCQSDRIVATAGTDKKLAFCSELGATDLINYRTLGDTSMDVRVKDATNGRGVDVVLDSVAGPHFQPSVKACAMDASYVLYATMGGSKLKELSLIPFMQKRVRLLPSTLRSRDIEYKRTLVDAFTNEAMPLLESGDMRPIVDSIFPIEEARASHERMEANLNVGKIVLEWQD